MLAAWRDGTAITAWNLDVLLSMQDPALRLLCAGVFHFQLEMGIPGALLLVDVLTQPLLGHTMGAQHQRDVHATTLLALNLWWLAHSLMAAYNYSPAPTPPPVGVALLLVMLRSMDNTEEETSRVPRWACLFVQVLATLVQSSSSSASSPLVLVLLVGFTVALEMDCPSPAHLPSSSFATNSAAPLSSASSTGSGLARAKLGTSKAPAPPPPPASTTTTGSGGGSNAVHKLFTKAFGNYDQFSREVTRYVREVKSDLSQSALQALNDKEIDFGSFELERKLASGGFCTVFRGKYGALKKPCAVKSFSSSDQLDSAGLCGLVKEIVTLIDLEHPNIIRVYGYCWLPQVCLVMEYMPKGTLHDMLVYKELELGWDSPLTGIAIQVADALSYLHTRTPQAIIHRDIKARNILMKDFRTCKLADFGLLTEENSTAPRAGTLRYVAPEVAQGEDFFQQNRPCSDIWSLGVCLWEMATRSQFGGVPFAGVGPARRLLFHSHLPYPIPMPLYQVIDECLEPDPAKRTITALDIKERLQDCLEICLSEDRSDWFTGDMSAATRGYGYGYARTTAYGDYAASSGGGGGGGGGAGGGGGGGGGHNDLSVDASQAWRVGSAMWRNTGNMRPRSAADSSSRSLEAAIAQAKQQPAPPPAPPPTQQQPGGFLSRLAVEENRTQAVAYDLFAKQQQQQQRGGGGGGGLMVNMMEAIPELSEPSPSLSKQSIKSWPSSTTSSATTIASAAFAGGGMGEETPPFVEQRRPLAESLAEALPISIPPPPDLPPPSSSPSSSDAATNRFLARMREQEQQQQQSSFSITGQEEEETPAATNRFLNRLVDEPALPASAPQQLSMMERLALAERQAAAAAAAQPPPQEEEEQQQQHRPKTLVRTGSMAFTSADDYDAVDYDAMFVQASFLNESTPPSPPVDAAPPPAPPMSMLSRLAHAEKQTSRSLQAPPPPLSSSLQSRLNSAERETSRSFQAHLDAAQPPSSSSSQLLTRLRPPKLAQEDADRKNMRDRLDRAEKQTSRSLFERFEHAPAAEVQQQEEGNVFLQRVSMDQGAWEGHVIDRLDRAEKQTSRSLAAVLAAAAKQEEEEKDSVGVAAPPQWLGRVGVEEEDEGMINRIDRVEKQTSRSLFERPPQEPAGGDAPPPLLSRLGEAGDDDDEDEGLVNRIDRKEKESSRSLYARLQQQAAAGGQETEPAPPLLARLGLDADEDDDEGAINRLDRAEKQTSRSLFARFSASSSPCQKKDEDAAPAWLDRVGGDTATDEEDDDEDDARSVATTASLAESLLVGRLFSPGGGGGGSPSSATTTVSPTARHILSVMQATTAAAPP